MYLKDKIYSEHSENNCWVYHIVAYHRLVAKKKNSFRGDSSHHCKRLWLSKWILRLDKHSNIHILLRFMLFDFAEFIKPKFFDIHIIRHEKNNARCRLLFLHSDVSWFFAIHLYATWYFTMWKHISALLTIRRIVTGVSSICPIGVFSYWCIIGIWSRSCNMYYFYKETLRKRDR